MTIQWNGGNILWDGGNIAHHADCCCGVSAGCCGDDCTTAPTTLQLDMSNVTPDTSPCYVCDAALGTTLASVVEGTYNLDFVSDSGTYCFYGDPGYNSAISSTYDDWYELFKITNCQCRLCSGSSCIDDKTVTYLFRLFLKNNGDISYEFLHHDGTSGVQGELVIDTISPTTDCDICDSLESTPVSNTFGDFSAGEKIFFPGSYVVCPGSYPLDAVNACGPDNFDDILVDLEVSIP